MTDGTAVFSDLTTSRSSKKLGLFILILLSALVWLISLLMQGNQAETSGSSFALWMMAGLALLLTAIVALVLGARIMAFSVRLFHPPATVIVDADGVHQTGSTGKETDLTWEDIRLIQHRRTAHLVRGRDKRDQIEISALLKGHKTASAFLKFAFLLRQEIGIEWRGLLTEVRSRLEGPGFHFHYDGDRTDTVYVNSYGIKHSSIDGIESEMPWDLMRESILDVQKDKLKFRHTGSKTSITIPRGTDSDEVVDEFIRWALHTEPSFSSNTA